MFDKPIISEFTPTNYTFHLTIRRDDHLILDTLVETPGTTEGVRKAKRNIQRLLTEYTPVVEVKVEAGAPEPPPEPEPKPAPTVPLKKPSGARGLLRLHCKGCGNTFGTFLREHQAAVPCKCGQWIDLTAPLARYHFTCPYCEKETWGATNLEDPDIVIQCKCGKDIDLQWVPSAKEYRN